MTDALLAKRARALALITLLIVAAAALVAAVIHGFLQQAAKPRKSSVQQIMLLRPPPPPPPKPQEKPPEPEMKQEVKLPEPEKTPEPAPAKDEPPADKVLGLDAEGGPGSDGFGLAARKGGRDLLSIGGGGNGSDGRRFAYYTARIQQQLQEALAREPKLRQEDYRAIVKIWLARDGRIERVELVNGTGNSATDGLLRATLAGLPALAEAPPETMPQPVRLRITSRAAG
ncbi:MAG: energy transducer TonB [Betaproteobacteria bacterium]|nr:energy transducer TonB [Betaproteobacteria bacterium]